MDLVKEVKAFRDGILDCPRFGNDPKGMCFAICSPLQSFLYAAHGIETKLVSKDFGFSNHVWLELPDGRILDPTADQFKRTKLPAVYLGPLPKIYQRWMQRASVKPKTESGGTDNG